MDRTTQMARRGLLLLALLLALLTGCERASGDAEPGITPEATPPTPVVEGEVSPQATEEETGLFDGVELPAITGDEEVPPPPADELATGLFENLRFATDGQGEPQSTFPGSTQEIYAIWDYSGMSASDQFTRRWYLNDQLEVEHVDALWDYLTYGSVGTVRDIYLYDYIDGIDPGRYRVELYLNGELQQSAEFDVQ